MKIMNSFLQALPSFNQVNQVPSKKLLYGNFSNLSPLPADTVSFGARGKKTSESDKPSSKTPKTDKQEKPKSKLSSTADKKAVQSSRGQAHVAQRLYDESEYAAAKLKFILGQYFSGVAITDIDSDDFKRTYASALRDNIDKPVVVITTRRKHPESIAEKMGSRKVRGIEATKKELTDLIGARIIVSGNSTKEGDYVVDRLTQAVKDKRIKILQVKTHGQENSRLNYVSRGKLNKLVDTARKHNSPTCKYLDEPRDSGYLAVHIITDELEDGYKGEIQIMGLDVARFKEIEDLCYKCHTDKSAPKKYDSFMKQFSLFDEDEELLRDFLEYTKRAYAFERQKKASSHRSLGEMLPIPDDLAIPHTFDFNELERQKDKIDTQKK